MVVHAYIVLGTISVSFESCRVRSLRDLAASNTMMLAYLRGLLRASPGQLRPHLNVVTTDFSETPALLPLVVALDTEGIGSARASNP